MLDICRSGITRENAGRTNEWKRPNPLSWRHFVERQPAGRGTDETVRSGEQRPPDGAKDRAHRAGPQIGRLFAGSFRKRMSGRGFVRRWSS